MVSDFRSNFAISHRYFPGFATGASPPFGQVYLEYHQFRAWVLADRIVSATLLSKFEEALLPEYRKEYA